ncbi:MAG: GGDEF domain-containing protein [Anaerotignum sp.]|nr:GGDEF domain-containing protein [Anaerotignum sp.]
MFIMEKMKRLDELNNYVTFIHAEDEWKNQAGVTLITSAAFFMMSLVNILQKSYIMLAATLAASLFLMGGYFIGRKMKNVCVLRAVDLIVFLVVLTIFTVIGGNDGFAILWLLLAPYVAMMVVDMKNGFFISLYYLILLMMLFWGPLQIMLQYEYEAMFRLRFPFLYMVDFAFATFIASRIRKYQYQLLLKQQELERISFTDLTTRLLNRNSFNRYQAHFHPEEQESLSAVFIDVNGLHEVNNKLGHAAGDHMLYEIANLCKEFFPKDTVYRMGGDEMLIVCKNRTHNEVLANAEKLSEAVDATGHSVAFGVETQTNIFDLDNLVNAADRHMLACKEAYYLARGRCER